MRDNDEDQMLNDVGISVHDSPQNEYRNHNTVQKRISRTKGLLDEKRNGFSNDTS